MTAGHDTTGVCAGTGEQWCSDVRLVGLAMESVRIYIVYQVNFQDCNCS